MKKSTIQVIFSLFIILFLVCLVGASNIQSHPIIEINEFDTSSGYEINLTPNYNFNIQGNLTLWDKITFKLGEVIDNIVSGWITITGGLNVTENITASYFIGNGSQLTGLTLTESDPLWTANQSLYRLLTNYIFAGNILAPNLNTSDTWTFVGNEAGSGATGSDLVFLGYRAGADNLYDYGTFVGSWAGDASSGAANTFIGYSAGYANSGERVVGLGYATASDNEGNYVIVLGNLAGDTNKGNYSIGLGYEALKSNTGNDVVAIGDQAGESNTASSQFIVKQTRINAMPLIQGNFSSGYVGIGTISPLAKLQVNGNILASNFNVTDARTFVGVDAGTGATITDSTCVGYDSCDSAVGEELVAIGIYAGWESDGNYNTFIGSNAGDSNTGSFVTGVGYTSVYTNVGDYVSALGYYAGYSNLGNYSIGIGYEALKSNSGNNVIAIGDQAGEGNTLSDQFIVKQTRINAMPLIQGNFSSGNVGIGTITPLAKLHVNGTGRFENALDIYRGSNQLGLYADPLEVYIYADPGLYVYSSGYLVLESYQDTISFEADNFAFDTNTLFINAISNKIGIGTTTPQNTLNVIGELNVTENAYFGQNVTIDGNLIGGSVLNIGGSLDVAGNITIDSNNRFCLNQDCSSYIYNNGTHSIWK